MAGANALDVLVDGVKLPENEARAFWERFSDWMEEHKGDLGGFAVQEGYASVRPAISDGRPVLVASRSAAQVSYGNAQDLAAGSKGAAGPKRRPPASPAAARPKRRR